MAKTIPGINTTRTLNLCNTRTHLRTYHSQTPQPTVLPSSHPSATPIAKPPHPTPPLSPFLPPPNNPTVSPSRSPSPPLPSHPPSPPSLSPSPPPNSAQPTPSEKPRSRVQTLFSSDPVISSQSKRMTPYIGNTSFPGTSAASTVCLHVLYARSRG